MHALLCDIRFGFRSLKKNPGTTLVILFALALGIGVNASSFSMVNALVLRPLPYPNLDRIMTLWEAPANVRGERGPAAPANFLDWKEQSRSFEYLAAMQPWDANLSGIGEPERVQACRTTAEFFPILGLRPLLGRAFREDETRGTSANVVVVSEGFWKRRLAGAPDAIGKTVSLNGAVHTVVGVMPADFNFPLETEVWAPLIFSTVERHDREAHNLSVLGRLKSGVAVRQARTELQTIAGRLASQHPDTNENRDALVISLRELTNDVTDRFTLTLLATAGFVLLLACANVGNLLLLRLASRRREIAVRLAIGARRWDIARQLLMESLILALASGAAGLLLASWHLSIVPGMIPAQVLKWVAGIRDMRIDTTVVLFTLAASLITALLAIAPALLHVARGASTGLNEALKEGGRGGSAGQGAGRLRTALVVSEVALALILLAGAAVMVQTFNRLLAVSPGYQTGNLLTMQIALPPAYTGHTAVTGFYNRLLDGLTPLADARSAAISAFIGPAQGVFVEGRPEPRPGEPVPYIHTVSGRFFETLRLPLVRGRGISQQDDNGYQPVVVVSQTVARHYWPKEDPIGRHIRLSKSDPRWLTVIGVSGDVTDWFTNRPTPRVYVSFLQTPSPAASVLIRTSGDPYQVAPAAREAVWKVDRTQPVFDVKSMEQQINEETSGVRAAAVTMSAYAAISLALAVMGIYAVISYSVTQRTHEIGVRMAVGAAAHNVLRMTLADAARLGAFGLAIGAPVTLILIKLMSSVLYGVVRFDVLVFAGMVTTLAVSAVLAGYFPALRASRVDPVTALRSE
jgi:putative ABC transport system permease protein